MQSRGPAQIQPRKITKAKVKDQVLEALEEMIGRGGYSPGDRLPSEGELSTAFGVGTRSVREALATLEARGMVEIKHGKGIYLASNQIEHYMESLADSVKLAISQEREVLLDLVRFRKFIEAEVVQQVARSRSTRQVEALKGIVDGMRAAATRDDIDQYNALDRSFHESLVEATGNRVVIPVYRHLRNLLMKSISATGYIQRNLQASLREHERLYEHVRDRRPKAARELIVRHLAHSEQTLREGVPTRS